MPDPFSTKERRAYERRKTQNDAVEANDPRIEECKAAIEALTARVEALEQEQEAHSADIALIKATLNL